MNDLVLMKDGVAMVSSKKVADRFKKPHKTVMRAISLLECSEEFRGRNFVTSSYLSPQNKEFKCYDITKDGFMFMAMGFTGKEAAEWKESYINAFNEMERSIIGSDSLMNQINKAIGILETDKAIASSCAKGLSKWKSLKKEHKSEIERLISSSQMALGFDYE